MPFDLRSVAGLLLSLGWVALRAFAGTLVSVLLAGIVLAALSYSFLQEYPWWYGAIAVAVAIAESIVTGILLGIKRAGVLALAHGLGELRLGRFLVQIIFERMLGITQEEEFGERGGLIPRSLERLPLAQADERLSAAIRRLTEDAAQGRWLYRKMQRIFLEAVRKFTLARFREEGAKHGGIDLLKVKEELEDTIDAALVRKVRNGLRLWTALTIIGLPVVVAAQTWVMIMLAHSKG